MRTRTTAKSTGHRREILGVSLLTFGLLLGYSVLSPRTAGTWGRALARSSGWLFGAGRFGIPFLLAAYGIHLLRDRTKRQHALTVVLGLGAVAFICSQLSLFGEVAWGQNLGGLAGLGLSTFFERLFGAAGAWILNATGLVLIIAAMARHSPVKLALKFWKALGEDVRGWKAARAERREQRAPVIKPRFGAEPSNGLQKKPPVIKEMKRPTAPAEESFDLLEDRPFDSFALGAPQGELALGRPAAAVSVKKSAYQLPSLSLLSPPVLEAGDQADQLKSRAELLERTLAHFNITAQVIEIHPGPVVTRYDLEPAPGIKVSSIASRSNDVALALKAVSVRVLAPVPGKGAVGIEIPNDKAIVVKLREILEAPQLQKHRSPLAFALGKSVSGEACIGDLAQMPHLLVAGSTGAGKSVCIHSLILSLVYRSSPDLVKLVLIDPKRLELTAYEGIPHLYDPRHPAEEAGVITVPKEAAKALQRLIRVMEIRYEAFAKANVRNIEGYNEKRAQNRLPAEHYLVVIIDELADLMLTVPKDVEDCIQRLAQMARAVGIHLVLATQRPSVDVITGVIKANLPSRIALRVSSQTDSRVILDSNGAECLLGSGDMLFLPAGSPQTIRVQGAYVSAHEVESVVNFLKSQGGPSYEDLFKSASSEQLGLHDDEELKDLHDALKLIQSRRRVSQDLLKAHLGSSARATNILSLLEVKEFIHKPEGTNRWEIYFDKVEDFLKAHPETPAEAS
jgi:S-DNA-T family DNA segregation ATPase FtsK/SpoIIIE